MPDSQLELQVMRPRSITATSNLFAASTVSMYTDKAAWHDIAEPHVRRWAAGSKDWGLRMLWLEDVL